MQNQLKDFKKSFGGAGRASGKSNYPLIALFLLPSVLLVGVFVYYPAIRGIFMAFQDVKSYNMFSTEWCGLDNFRTLFKTAGYVTQWKNTFIWMIGCVGGELILGFGLALLLQKSFKGKGLYEGIVYMPWALSGFMVGIMWKWIFNGSGGVLNDLLMRLGIISAPVNWLTTPGLNLNAIIVAKVWTGLAFFAIISSAALKTVPRELYESAELDGANAFPKFRNITLPGIKTIMLMTILLRAIQTFGSPDLIYSMTQGGPANSSQIVTSFIYLNVMKGGDYGMISAASLIMWVFIMVCSAIYIKATNALKAGD